MEIANPLATLEKLESELRPTMIENLDLVPQQIQELTQLVPAQQDQQNESEIAYQNNQVEEPILKERESIIYKIQNEESKNQADEKLEKNIDSQTENITLTQQDFVVNCSQNELTDKTNSSNKQLLPEKYNTSASSNKTDTITDTFKQNNILNQILEQLISKVGSGNNSNSTTIIKDKSNTENQDPGSFNIEDKESVIRPINQNNSKKNTVTITSRLPPMELKQQLIQQSMQLQQQQQQQQIQQQQRKSRKTQQIKDIKITDLIEVSKQCIKFGTVLPGNIFEESLEVMNLSNESLVIKIFVQCLNPEFEDHDEYVYSVRKTTAYDYNEKYFVLIPPFKSMMFKIALKVPNIREQKTLKGMTLVSIQGIEQCIKIPICSQIEIPNIQCVKELYVADHDLNIIKLAIKRGKKQDCKIPLKNNHSAVLTFEVEWLEDQEEEDSAYQLILHPLVIVVQPKSPFLINAILKQNPKFKGNFQQKLDLKKVLLLKIRNSSLIYSFPILIEIY